MNILNLLILLIKKLKQLINKLKWIYSIFELIIDLKDKLFKC